MAGKKGRSGGARNNSGRKKKVPSERVTDHFQRRVSHATTSTQSSTQATATSTRSERSSNTDTQTSAQNNDNVEDNPTVEVGDLPNYDAEQDDELLGFEDNKKTGKKINASINLRTQRQNINTSQYFEKAKAQIKKNGHMWDLPPSFVNTTTDLSKCWMDFFKLRVFNWIPECIIGDEWRPKCPCCGKKLAHNGHNKPPRLVFDQCDNYWLNAPQNYRCVTCERNKESKYLYSSTCDEILKQISMTHPEVMTLFPCHLSKRNAIDKNLMEMVIHCAVKGVGPAAMAGNIASFHELKWQKQENMWARSVVKWLSQPGLMQQPINREDIEKCPGYFSLSMGGCVPSGVWLLEMFNSIIEGKRSYYDAECIKRAITSEVLAMDASYKVSKWMMLWGGEKMYEALISFTNEFNEVPGQIFATSDNHEEIRNNLEALKSLGLNPKLCFTDDPGRDESLLKDIFPSLKSNHDDNDDDDDEGNIDESLVDMQSEKTCHYVYDMLRAEILLAKFIQDIEEALKDTAGPSVKIAFDAEWPVYITNGPGPRKKVPGNINILQLSSNVTNYTIVLELYNFTSNTTHLKRIGLKLKAIFQLKVECFTGRMHKNDYKLLKKQYPEFELNDLSPNIFHDVGEMALNRGIVQRGKNKTTLEHLCRKQGIRLKKPKNVRVGTCFASKRGSLSKEAVTYCQLDVEAPLLLHQLYSGMPDLTKRLKREDKISIGTVVDIMPEDSTNIHPIAQGVVKKLGGEVWSTNGVKIRKDQVLVEVQKVFNHKGIIHYPHTKTKAKACACGRAGHGAISDDCTFFYYSQFGPPSFETLEIKSRLRARQDTINYPACIYEKTNEVSVPSQVRNHSSGIITDITVDGGDDSGDDHGEPINVVNGDDNNNEDSDDDVSACSNDGEEMPSIPEFLLDDVVKSVNGDEEGDTMGEDIRQASQREIAMAIRSDFEETLHKLIEDADKLAENMNEDDMYVVHDDLPEGYRKVLGDIFHLMDRAKLPMHHEYKALFFRSLRAAMFIMVEEDVEDVKSVLESKPGESWEKMMAFNFRYISQRVRRRVPEPKILYSRMKAVYEFFRDKVDSKTGKILFHETNRNKFENVLEMVKKGYASDPPGMSLYVLKTDKYGKPMKDEDGLVLYRSIRGTSNLESLHQYLTTSFGHTRSGPRYSDNLLTILRHMYNWRMSLKNRPKFPNILHYDGLLIDRINALYEMIYGYRKYRNWQPFNEYIPSVSVYGIVPIKNTLTSSLKATEEDKELLSKNGMLSYLARRQNSDLPFLPIRGENEKKLIHKMLCNIVQSELSLKNQSVYEKVALDWNTNHVDISKKIYPKMPCHIARYVKSWSKNQDRRAAALASGSQRLSNVLEYVPALNAAPNFEPAPLHQDSNDPTEENEAPSNIPDLPNNDPTEGIAANCSPVTETPIVERPQMLCQLAAAASTQPEINIEEPAKKKRKRRPKTCQGIPELRLKCPQPDTCKGRGDRANCVLKTNGDKSKERKRTITNWSRPKCFTCKKEGCLGITNRTKCPDWKD